MRPVTIRDRRLLVELLNQCFRVMNLMVAGDTHAADSVDTAHHEMDSTVPL